MYLISTTFIEIFLHYESDVIKLMCTVIQVHILISVMVSKFTSLDFFTPDVKWKFTKCSRVSSLAHEQKAFLEVLSL